MLHFARWKIATLLLTVLAGFVFAAPNLFPERTLAGLPDWVPSDRINLGLDLQGGSHLLLEVDVASVERERLEALTEETRAALRKERIGYRKLGVQDGAMTVRIRDDEKLAQAQTLIAELGAAGIGTNALNLLGGSGQEFTVENPEAGLLRVRLTPQALDSMHSAAVQQSIEIVRRRIDELGTREPTIQRQGGDRILVQVPGLDDPQRLKELLGKTAKLAFRLVDLSVSTAEAQQGRVPAGSELLPSEEAGATAYVVRKKVMVSGENLVDAQPSTDSQTNEPVVLFRFDAAGGKRFADVTKENVGRPFAIVLDGKVVSAPVIRTAILGGSGQISGNFTFQEANDLAILLRAGALPAPLNIIEERTVGAELGADSVRAGQVAAIIGLVAVLVYIALSYGMFGLFANLALLVNLVLIAGTLSLLQATLTLPGIAGIVLTVGMAVDANVLIFERIREELRNGKSPLNAVDTGYQRAYGTILDANITTFIAAIILFQIGSGPVRGFSVTLAIGILTSVFTAVTLTRLIVVYYLRRKRPSAISL